MRARGEMHLIAVHVVVRLLATLEIIGDVLLDRGESLAEFVQHAAALLRLIMTASAHDARCRRRSSALDDENSRESRAITDEESRPFEGERTDWLSRGEESYYRRRRERWYDPRRMDKMIHVVEEQNKEPVIQSKDF